MIRYWVVKVPGGTMAETVMGLLDTLDEHEGVQVVEVIPEQRTLGWAEEAILKKFGPKS